MNLPTVDFVLFLHCLLFGKDIPSELSHPLIFIPLQKLSFGTPSPDLSGGFYPVAWRYLGSGISS